MTEPNLSLMRRLAREFVDEYLAGRPHRKATREEAPTTRFQREQQIHRYHAERERRAFLRARRMA